MSGFVHTPMSLPPVAFGTDPTGAVAVQILGGGGGGGGGATTIIALLDTPGAYGTAGQVLAVNSGRTGMEFVDQAGSGFDGAFASLTGLPTTLAGYGITDAAPISHTQSMASITGLSAQLTALSDAIDTKAAASHTHAIGDTTGLQAALDGKSATGHTHAASEIISGTLAVARGGTGSTGFITPTYYTAGSATVSAHLAGIDTAIGGRAAASHTHAFSALTGIPTTLAGYGITDAAPISHTHSAADIIGGTLAVARGGTGSTGFITPTYYTAGAATVSAHLAGIDTAIGGRAAASHTHAFSALTGIPTTLAGYGITDAAGIGHTHTRTDGYIGHVEAPTARTYYIELACPVGRTITRIDAITSAGTVDLTLKNGAATVWTADGIDSSGVSITSGLANTSLALNGTLSLVVDAVSSGADLRFAVRFTETVPAP